jgi:hypothetical protein
VLADDSVGVRNYRKRLAALKSQNPFKPQFHAPQSQTPAADASNDTAAVGGATSESTSAGAAEVDIGLDADANVADGEQDVVVDDDVTVDETTDEGGNGGGNGGNGGTQPTEDDVEVVESLFTYRVDLAFGLVGDPKLREGVKPMTILPDPARPVLAFLGTDEKGKRAAFVLSKDATVVSGDAACVPTPENCLYITLEKNEQATLAYAPTGEAFNLRLLGIEDHEIR